MIELVKYGMKCFVIVMDKLFVFCSLIYIEIEFGNLDIVVCLVLVFLIYIGIGDVFGCL